MGENSVEEITFVSQKALNRGGQTPHVLEKAFSILHSRELCKKVFEIV
jgi:hypothetical protein